MPTRASLLVLLVALPASLAAQVSPVAGDDLAPLTSTPPVVVPLVLTSPVIAPTVGVPPPVNYPLLRGPYFNPAADYVTAGQDEPGYRAWYAKASWRPVYVRAFHDYLVASGVSGVAPTWQLLRTATFWRRCGAEPFEVPPTADWVNIVATLRFIGSHIIPLLGPVEPVSVYRNPALNDCAGGALNSTHREMGAVDVVPLRPIRREELMVRLCAIHTASANSNVGLGFYKGLRFHIDARKYREWGTAGALGGVGCTAVLAEGAAPFIADVPPPTAAVADPSGLVLRN